MSDGQSVVYSRLVWFGLVYWCLTPQQQPGSYQGGEMMMMMKSVFWWRKPEYPDLDLGLARLGLYIGVRLHIRTLTS